MSSLLDEDLNTMSKADLRLEVKRLRAGIRQHRDATGHNLCWYVPELWNLLPERATPEPAAPSREEFLKKCSAYHESIAKENKHE